MFVKPLHLFDDSGKDLKLESRSSDMCTLNLCWGKLRSLLLRGGLRLGEFDGKSLNELGTRSLGFKLLLDGDGKEVGE